MILAGLIITAVAALAGVGGFFIGYRQGKIAQAALDLSLAKAVPKVGTTAEIGKRQENPSNFPPFYYVIVTLYNEGELPAQQLDGECRIYSVPKGVKERIIPIKREFLGVTPYQLESYRIESAFSGMTLNLGGQEGQSIRFNVDIEFEYVGSSNDPLNHYRAKYEYDPKTKQLVKI